jgi:hypothetical protein
MRNDAGAAAAFAVHTIRLIFGPGFLVTLPAR